MFKLNKKNTTKRPVEPRRTRAAFAYTGKPAAVATHVSSDIEKQDWLISADEQQGTTANRQNQ